MHIHGPGANYTLLFDDDQTDGPGLPPAFQAIYAGDWHMPPAPDDRPFLYTNFVASHDGRTSFDLPGRSGGGDVSRHAAHDTWLMGLLRARADAIIVGGATLRLGLRHRWTAEGVYGADAAAFAALRAGEGRTTHPLLVVLSGRGDLPADAAWLHVADQQVWLATTTEGATRAREQLGHLPNLRIEAYGDTNVDLRKLLSDLRGAGVRHMLSEGGAKIYAGLLRDQLIDEVFLTISPIVIGNPAPPEPPRTSLVDGVAFHPDNPPRLELISLRRFEHYLFQRARIR
jgi:riboflavin biosynthesis pyrimidine reductase